MLPCWYWDRKDIENSPSRQQGLSAENEARYRKEGAKFIHKLGLELKLHHDTLATAAVFYHRFYQQHSFVKFRQRYVTATCCLFLAGKVEETPKKCKDLVRLAKQLLSEQHFASFGGSGPNAEVTAREEVMAMERVLLQAIKFDFNVVHPYKYIIEYAEQLRNDIQGRIEEKQMENLVQQSWNFTNDSLQTTLCLQWEPEIIAISMIFLSAKLAKIEVLAASTKWWEKFIPDLSMELIESVCHSVLDIYQSSKMKKSKTPKRKDVVHTEGTPEKRLKADTVDQGMLKQLILQNLDAGKLSELVRAQAENAANNQQQQNQAPETPTPRISSQPPHDHRPQPMSASVPTTPIQAHGQRPPFQQNLNPNQFHTPQPQRGGHQEFSGAWRPSTPQNMNQGGPHGGYGMQGVQRPPVPMQHQGYGGGPAQHGGWDNTRNQQQMNGIPSGPRGGRRGYGPSGNSFGQGGYQNQSQWR